ncbi:hypothetical protein FRY98_06770 [Paenibacillus faecis]|uniref:Uncharacterized protein n=1 Tax=Paenibacillus faecis TaxID=862114 RepID=A0A5D0D161_9BACL|nr:hypothetical protein [Paenibacillus faecis]TYA15324.1 hypothetical protein FRY98_06770 [Paenibacillus faecis]
MSGAVRERRALGADGASCGLSENAGRWAPTGLPGGWQRALGAGSRRGLPRTTVGASVQPPLGRGEILTDAIAAIPSKWADS